jgi:hypothetical protein
MARAKKRGAAKDRDGDGDFKPGQRSPTKKNGSPQKKSTTATITTTPHKGRNAQQQDTVDEGIAATPDAPSLQAQVTNDDSTYDSSSQQQTPQSTPFQIPARANAARSIRNEKKVVGSSSGSFEREASSAAESEAGQSASSKVVILKVSPRKLRGLLEADPTPEKKVTLKFAPERLRMIQQESVQGAFVKIPTQQAEDPAEGEATMAPVKDKNPHDVLDGKSCQNPYYIVFTDDDAGRSSQGSGSESL